MPINREKSSLRSFKGIHIHTGFVIEQLDGLRVIQLDEYKGYFLNYHTNHNDSLH